MNPDLQLAQTLADMSDRITLRHFRGTFSVRTKNDQTPVTEVDEEVERAIRERLNRDRPDDAIIGRRESVVDGWPRVENALRALPNGASGQ